MTNEVLHEHSYACSNMVALELIRAIACLREASAAARLAWASSRAYIACSSALWRPAMGPLLVVELAAALGRAPCRIPAPAVGPSSACEAAAPPPCASLPAPAG